jgi:hypothetical protein
MPFRISPPTQITLVVSVALAILALVARYSGIAIPFIGEHTFGTLLISYLVLLAGNLIEGI